MHRITWLHSGWRFAAASWLPEPQRLGYGILTWQRAEVPGHVHTDLVRAGIIADPLTEQHELGAQWVDEEDWIYETEFAFSSDAELPRRLLRFEGLDTLARVFLNDRLIAEHDDMFIPCEIDVAAALVDGTNRLRVEFASATRTGRERRAEYFRREGLPDDVERFEERAFVRKAQFMFGWDWGPRLVSAGVWRPVSLIEYRARLCDVHVRQRHLPKGSVELVVTSSIEGEGRVKHALEHGGRRHEFRDGEVVRIEQPELWWPLGMGAQALHALETTLTDDAGRTLDRREQRLGLRRIRLVQEPDEFGTSFAFEVNGRPLFALGANFIPDHSFPSQVDEARVRHRLVQARDLGMNMLRIWGGGLYESDAFYDACDELGILVWQDFPFACNYAPDDEAARTALRREATAAILRLRNRASLAIWCGNNENLTMFESKWGRAEHHPARCHGERLWEETLPALLAELDPERPYLASSPIGGPTANSDVAGDQHNWDVWHGRGDHCHYRDSRGRFISEFGFASAPGRRAWRPALGDALELDRVEPRHPIARWHDKTLKGYETFIGYVELHYPRAQTLADWTYYSQLNQRDAMRVALEHYRSGRFCRGTLIWQLNDCWPSQSWALLDCRGDYKAAAFELRRLYAPLLACVEVNEGSVAVTLAYDNQMERRLARLRVALCDLGDGRTLAAREATLELAPDERRRAVVLPLTDVVPSEVLLSVTVDDRGSCRLLCEPRDASVVLAPLEASFRAKRLELSSPVPVVDLFIWSEADDFFPEENFCSLPAPGVLSFACPSKPRGLRARSLAGEHELRWAD